MLWTTCLFFLALPLAGPWTLFHLVFPFGLVYHFSLRSVPSLQGVAAGILHVADQKIRR
jgi:hypothetical protein